MIFYAVKDDTQSEEILKILLNNGANPLIQDKEGNTPLMTAITLDDTNILKTLLKKCFENSQLKEALLIENHTGNTLRSLASLYDKTETLNNLIETIKTPSKSTKPVDKEEVKKNSDCCVVL